MLEQTYANGMAELYEPLFAVEIAQDFRVNAHRPTQVQLKGNGHFQMRNCKT